MGKGGSAVTQLPTGLPWPFSILTSLKLNSSPFSGNLCVPSPVFPISINRIINASITKTGNLASSLNLSLFLSPTSNYIQVLQIVPATHLVNSSPFPATSGQFRPSISRQAVPITLYQNSPDQIPPQIHSSVSYFIKQRSSSSAYKVLNAAPYGSFPTLTSTSPNSLLENKG